MQGTTLGVELVQELKKETRALSKYILDVVSKIDISFQDVHTHLLSIEGTLSKTSERIENVETESSQLKRDLNSLTGTVTGLQDSQRAHAEKVKTDMNNFQSCVDKTQLDVSELDDKVDNLSLSVSGNKSEIDDIKTEVLYARTDITHTNTDINGVKSELKQAQEGIKTNTFEIKNTKDDVAQNKADIADLTKYLSFVRPDDKIFFYPPDRVSSFVSREDELERLRDGFKGRHNDTHTQVICGLGGIGKTTLAVEYAWTFQTFYLGGVFWMSAETNEALEDSVQRLAIDINTVGLNAKETLAKTLKWLSSIQECWLLVIDNVDMEEIRGSVKEILLQSWKRGSMGHIIITSRRETENAEETFYVNSEDCISLDVLSKNESVEFLMIRSGCNDCKNDESLEELAGELGGLPLALEQAAAHVKALHCSFADYLKKFNRKRLGILKGIRSQYDLSKERLAVRTTWKLNFDYIEKQSEDDGLGNAAVFVMEIAAFLYADDIPMIVLNVGSPNVVDEDLLDTFHEELGTNQVAEILARFSLFNRSGCSSLNVHRLVQEVIRENMIDVDRKAFILECASRMINLALEKTQSPMAVLQDENIGRASLQMWNKLALNASTLKTHLFDFTKRNESKKRICFNLETARILQTSAIYHSLYQRQDEALACQSQMLSIIPALDISEHVYSSLTRIKIPLLQKDRLVIQSSVTMTLSTASIPFPDSGENQTKVLLDTESLNKMGNDAFKAKRYQVAIQCYSEAITASNESPEAKFLTNRSLANLKIGDYKNALLDADRCIQIDPKAWKAYCWKAYAISNLIRLEFLPKSWESAGLAAAAVAGHLNEECLLEYKMKIEYPLVRYIIIKDESELGREMASMMNRTYTTLLLQRGRYQIALDKGEITTKSVQIIGIENEVEIHSATGVALMNPKHHFPQFQIEPAINIYFENVTFPNETGQITISADVNTIFYRCKFSNGKKGCENFPLCEGKSGCVNTLPDDCRKKFLKQRNVSFPMPSGLVGFPGVNVVRGGNVLMDKCVFDRCGGGGTLSAQGGKMTIKNSIICNMRQMGIEARVGGFVYAANCQIYDNQFHGVAVGPKGTAQVKKCMIWHNKREGIWCGGILEKEDSELPCSSNPEGGSTCLIHDNLIFQNGMSGISLDGGSYDVSGNRIFDNWLWGMMVKSRSSTNICNNDIFENKCGGIRIGENYSAMVVLDGNSVRDHTGPAVHIVKSSKVNRSRESNVYVEMEATGMPDESLIFSIPPFISTRNLFEKNNRGQQHPRHMADIVEACCFCSGYSNKLGKCGDCKKASYCSKDCQKQHWRIHKLVCKLIVENFTVDIQMSDTVPWDHFVFGPKKVFSFRSRNAPLPGLGEGQPPDKLCENKFMVKIQTGTEYTPDNPNKDLRLYDQTQTLDIFFKNPTLYHMAQECGVLAATKLTVKKMFCWASYKDKGEILRVYTESLPPFQTW